MLIQWENVGIFKDNISTYNTALSKCIEAALRCLCSSPRQPRGGTFCWHRDKASSLAQMLREAAALPRKRREISSVFNTSRFHCPAPIHPQHLLCALCKRMRAPSHSLHGLPLTAAAIFWDKRRVISMPYTDTIFLATDIQLWSWFPEESQLLKNNMESFACLFNNNNNSNSNNNNKVISPRTQGETTDPLLWLHLELVKVFWYHGDEHSKNAKIDDGSSWHLSLLPHTSWCSPQQVYDFVLKICWILWVFTNLLAEITKCSSLWFRMYERCMIFFRNDTHMIYHSLEKKTPLKP